MNELSGFRASVVLRHLKKEKLIITFYERLLARLFADNDFLWSLDEVRRAGNLIVSQGRSHSLARRFVEQMKDRFPRYAHAVAPLARTVDRMFGEKRTLQTELIFFALMVVRESTEDVERRTFDVH